MTIFNSIREARFKSRPGKLVISSPADGIILGGSRMDHLVANMSACEEGPLEESE